MIAQVQLQADWLSHLLFESPGWVIVVLALLWWRGVVAVKKKYEYAIDRYAMETKRQLAARRTRSSRVLRGSRCC